MRNVPRRVTNRISQLDATIPSASDLLRARRDAERRDMSSEDRSGVVYEVLRAASLAPAGDTPDRSGGKPQHDMEGLPMPPWTELSGEVKSRWWECYERHLDLISPEDLEGETEDIWPAVSRHLIAVLNDFFGPDETR